MYGMKKRRRGCRCREAETLYAVLRHYLHSYFTGKERPERLPMRNTKHTTKEEGRESETVVPISTVSRTVSRTVLHQTEYGSVSPKSSLSPVSIVSSRVWNNSRRSTTKNSKSTNSAQAYEYAVGWRAGASRGGASGHMAAGQGWYFLHRSMGRCDGVLATGTVPPLFFSHFSVLVIFCVPSHMIPMQILMQY